jgi:excinuclease ABC subunit A
MNTLERRYRETESQSMKEYYYTFMSEVTCPSCHGDRLRPESLAVKIQDKNIADVARLSITEASKFFESLKLSPKDAQIAGRLLKEIKERLSFLLDVGLGYLTLDRRTGTLSGGEAQRTQLATQIGSRLTGVLYVLDEPSIGLHQRDHLRLLGILKRLRDLGNTIIVVEHDEETIRHADYVIDMGPGAGSQGGEVVAFGTLESILSEEKSLTFHNLFHDQVPQ